MDFKIHLEPGVVVYTDDVRFEDAEEVASYIERETSRRPAILVIGHVAFHSGRFIAVEEHEGESE